MTAKSTNPDLANCTCDGCNGTGHIRQQKTGKRLLYFYCPTCGMDKRSGELLQAKWRKLVDAANNGEAIEIQRETPRETAPKNPIQLDEWTPDYQTKLESMKNVRAVQHSRSELPAANRNPERITEHENDSSASSRADGQFSQILLGVGIFALAAIGIKARLQTA